MNLAVQRLVESMQMRLTPQTIRGADYQALREYNRALVLNYIRQHGPVARVELAKQTGLSRTTVSHIVGELLEDGFAQKGRVLKAAASGGRRATLLHFNGDLGVILGVDVGRSHLTIVATNLEGLILAERSGPMALDRGPAVCIPQIIAAIRAFIGEHALAQQGLVGIGVGIPGTLTAATRIYAHPPHMPGWDGINVQDALRRALPAPIFVDNDANMGALGEGRYGIGRWYDHFIYMKIGTGIGTGIIINHQIYRGSGGFAGEIGHTRLSEEGPRCDCGSYGCLETLASASAIVAESLREHAAADDSLQQEALDIVDVIALAQAGDAICQRVLARAGIRIGKALANLINLLNPSAIILDGSVSKAGDLLLEPLRQTISEWALAPSWRPVAVTLGTLGNHAIALGGVATVINEAFELAPTASSSLHMLR